MATYAPIAILVVAVLVGSWLALATYNALTTMIAVTDIIARKFGMPTPQRWRVNPDNKFALWFYRIDGAAVAIGAAYMLVTGQYPH